MKLLEKITYQEVDDWYEEQKSLLDETMYNNLRKGADFNKEKETYDKKYKKLLQEFDKKVLEAEAHNERAKKILGPINRFKNWYKKTKLKIKRYFAEKIKNYKHKRFEKKYKKMYHIKEKNFDIAKEVLAKKKK